ncbi:response regulator transcription factor [Cytobacillus gottheilii]|uniref:response regulator transcription factor n=1 Tax=Cytobacillus gottheilii TaxID=859144 RepID=UPI0024952288|nr:response regulator transcription factor [Cytobacillus gottheilii]
MNSILIVDDEPKMLDKLTLFLSPFYNCVQKQSGKQALTYLKQEMVALVILDIIMPEMDGWTTCEEIRKFSNVPIIMITARNEKEDIIKGLKLGADDYITKPFSEDELLARMESVLRRTLPQSEVSHSFKGLYWNKLSFELSYNQQPIFVTPKEFAIVGFFIKNQNKVVSRNQLLTEIWGQEGHIDNRTIDSHIRNVRDKLRKSGFPIDQHLVTVWGIGYRWNP